MMFQRGYENADNTRMEGLYGSGILNSGKNFTWEVEVPNGQYEVKFKGIHRHYGCAIENIFLGGNNVEGHRLNLFKPFERLVRNVLVRDGHLSFGAVRDGICGHSIAWMHVRQVPLTIQPVPFPSMSNIIWEQEVAEPNAPIGGVILKRLGYPGSYMSSKGTRWQYSAGSTGKWYQAEKSKARYWTCQQNWLLDDSDYCFPDSVAGEVEYGFKVVLSDGPCVGEASCSPEVHICDHVVKPTFCDYGVDGNAYECPIQM